MIDNNVNDEDMLVDQDEIMSISTDTTSDSDVIDAVNNVIPIVYTPRRQVRRGRRNQDMLGPVINQRLRNR